MYNAPTHTDVEAITTESASNAFGALIDHAADRRARVVLTRAGKAVAAIVPIEDDDGLEAMEDAHDAEMYREAMAAREAACEPAPNWDPSQNRFQLLISNHKRYLRGVPIGADRDPC